MTVVEATRRAALVALVAATLQAAGAVAAVPPAAAAAPFLWRVDGRWATSYLLGAVHLLPAGADTLPAALEQAYRQTDGVVFETDIGALATRAVQLDFVAAGHAGAPLSRRVGAALYQRIDQRARAVGMPMSLCDHARAWACALDLSVYAFMQAGFSEEYGVDSHFYGEAVADGKTVRWLESPRRHLGLFTGMTRALSHALLRAALEPDDGGLGSPRAIYRAWRVNDTATVAAFDRRLKRLYPMLYERLIRRRNANWMAQLRPLLDGASAELIVVGAAHLVGPDGLVAALRDAGYRVEPGLAPTRDELHAAWRSPAGHRPRRP